MSLRRLVPSDASVHRALMLEAYAGHPDAFTSSASERAALPLAWWAARLSEEERADELVLGAFRDEQLAGAAGLSFETREKLRHKTTLFGMYVSARFRRHGLGRQLVDAALVQARMRPEIRLAQLTVTHGNDAARRLYEQCGFVEFGREPFAVAVGNGFVSKVYMWCPLRIDADDACR